MYSIGRLFIPLICFFIAGCQSSGKKNDLNTEDVKKGETLFSNYGCTTCHSISGEKRYGPSLNHILGKEVEVMRKGKMLKLIIDRSYIERSIEDPEFEKVRSFSSHKMPKPDISETDVRNLADYILYLNLHAGFSSDSSKKQ